MTDLTELDQDITVTNRLNVPSIALKTQQMWQEMYSSIVTLLDIMSNDS